MKNRLRTLALSVFVFSGAQMLNAEEPMLPPPALTETIQAASMKFSYDTDLERALAAAQSENQMLLVEFTGSDWCPPCKRLKKDILSTQAFADYVASNNLRFVELDFPRAKGAIPPELMKKREAIMLRYNVQGFPSVVVIDADGMPYKKIVGGAKNTTDYTKMLSDALSTKAKFAEAVSAAQDKTGLARADALAAALEILPPDCRSYQKEIVKDLMENDPEDRLGFKQKSRRAALLSEQREILKNFFAKHRKKITPEGISAARDEALKLLNSPEIQPTIALRLNKFISDGYAMSHDLENALKYLKAAHAAAPETREGKSLVQWVENMEQVIEKLKKQKAQKKTGDAETPPVVE